MKILHICLCGPYTDNFSYQENMLPKFHKEMGLDVEIIASLKSLDENGKPCILKERSKRYINEYGIPVTRLEYKNRIFSKLFRQYKNTYDEIVKVKPDIIFVHGCQFMDIKYIKKYVENNPDVKVYVDNHSDFSNSARKFLSKNILHKIFWRYCAQLIEPYTKKFYGVLPARVDFLKQMYKIPSHKVKLLVMGADDDMVLETKNDAIKQSIRKRYNIKDDDFLIVTGGKIDNAKWQTLLLMQAIMKFNNDNIKLIVFGSVVNELKNLLNNYVDNNKIQYIGWINSADCYKYFSAADLVVFPGRHSVFWEQVVGLGIPMVVKYWEGTTHVDLGGNCKFIYNDSVEEIYNVLSDLISNREELKMMKEIAESKGMKYFSYRDISARAIELSNNS